MSQAGVKKLIGGIFGGILKIENVDILYPCGLQATI